MTVPANVSTVILSVAKNLSIRVRYFTSLRYVQYDKQRTVSF